MKSLKPHKILSIVLTICIILSCIVNNFVMAFAEEQTDSYTITESEELLDLAEDEKKDERSEGEEKSESEGGEGESEGDDESEEEAEGENEAAEAIVNTEENETEEISSDNIPDEMSNEDLYENLNQISDGTPEGIFTETTNEAENEVLEEIVVQNEGLRLNVEYPEQIKCGEPVIFTMQADSGSGNYQYRIASLYDSELVSVYDVSYGDNGTYTYNNEFQFTFFASGTYYIRFSAIDMDAKPVQTVTTGFYEHTLSIQDPQYPSVEQIVNDTVKQCCKECTTDFEKAVWLHDWILNHADYDHSYSYSSAEGVLARGKGTCESYHRAYVMLLNKAGLSTGRITGNGHVWTAVQMNGQWYQVDSTWDDMGVQYQGTYNEHLYFGLTDYIMGLVHSDHKSSVPGYESLTLENNYFIKTGEIKQWSEPFVQLVKENINNGKMEFDLPVTDSIPDSYKNVIYNLVAYQLSKQSWNGVNISATYKDSVITVKAEIGLGTLSSLTVTPPQKILYEKGEPVNKEGLTVTANYTNGLKILGKDEYQIKNFETSIVGVRTATIIFDGKEATFDYTVKETSVSLYGGVDYSAVFNYTYYISKYNDLKQAFGDDPYKALEHFVNTGMSEGRQGNTSFNVHTYKNRYADLRRAFGNDLKRYYIHYINNGKKKEEMGAEALPSKVLLPFMKESIILQYTIMLIMSQNIQILKKHLEMMMRQHLSIL